MTAPNGTAPAFSLPPLHQLGLNARWDVEPEPFSVEKHTKQQGLDVAFLPFTRSPTRVIKELMKLPRTNGQRTGIDLGRITSLSWVGEEN